MNDLKSKFIMLNDLGKGVVQNARKINLGSQEMRGFCTGMKNVYSIPQGSARKVRGYIPFLATAISGTPTITSTFQFKDKNGTLQLICTTSDGKMRLYDGTDFDTELATGLTIGTDLVWNWTTFDNGTDIWAIGANGQGDFYKTDGTLGNTAAISGSPPSNVQWVASFKNRLWASLVDNNVYSSGVLNEDSWDTTNDFFKFDDDNDFGCTGLKTYSDRLFFSKEQALYYLTQQIPTQITSSAFRRTKLLTDNGFVNGNCVEELPTGELEFLGKENVYRIRGNAVYNVGSFYIQGYFDQNLDFPTINESKGLYFTCGHIQSNNHIHYIFSTTGPNNDEGFIHDYSQSKGGWYPINTQPFHCLAKYESGGKRGLLAGGIGDGQLYQLDTGNDYDTGAVTSEMIFFWDSLDNYNSIKQGRRIWFAFESKGKLDLTVGLAKDGDIENEVTRVAEDIGSGLDKWDVGEWDVFQWGDAGSIIFKKIEFEPHPDTGDIGLGEFKRLRLRLYNGEINQPMNILAIMIEYFDVSNVGYRGIA